MDILDIAIASKLAKGKGGKQSSSLRTISDYIIYTPDELSYENWGEPTEGELFLVYSDNDGSLPINVWTAKDGKWNIEEAIPHEIFYYYDGNSKLYVYEPETEGYLIQVNDSSNYIYQHNVSFTYNNNVVDDIEVRCTIINKDNRRLSDLTKSEFASTLGAAYGIVGLVYFKADDAYYTITGIEAASPSGIDGIYVKYIKDNKITSNGGNVVYIDNIKDTIIHL